MADQELLELAAKAAGIEGGYVENVVCGVLNVGGICRNGVVNATDVLWNPLRNDGDALRLAVKLGLAIYVDDVDTHVVALYRICATEEHGDDPYAATRRAIVRAAAEIGKTLK